MQGDDVIDDNEMEDFKSLLNKFTANDKKGIFSLIEKKE